jgi:ATP-dependent DNA helicase RecG
LIETPPAGLAGSDQRQLQQLAEEFADYPAAGLGRRQQLVQKLRQGLHQLLVRHRPVLPPAPPKLRLAPLAPGQAKAAPGATPDLPLAQLPGIGPRTASRLASLGLLLVRDLIRHYPRDYLDYSNLVRISALESGRTATIVASVRRSHAFCSPRNPNLSIHELHVQDSTGRLRISRFFAGRRYTSSGWLHAQQRLYPPGATVAISGLVKEGPCGASFSDPLIEVLEGPSSSVRSDRIGRLTPVYALTEGLTAEKLRQAIASVLPAVAAWPDPLPKNLRDAFGLMDRAVALGQIHRPEDQAQLQSARTRLVFDEFLLLQLALGLRRERLRRQSAPALLAPGVGRNSRRFGQAPTHGTPAARRRGQWQNRGGHRGPAHGD